MPGVGDSQFALVGGYASVFDTVKPAPGQPMLQALRARGSVPWTELDRQEVRDVAFAAEPRERDSLWRIIVRRAPEPDE